MAIEEWGGRDRLELRDDLVEPPVAPDGVLLRVRAAGANPVDYKVREGYLAGAFPSHFPLVPGWDAAGVVEAVGPAVTWFRPGDEVFGYCRRHDIQFGTYAQYTTVPEGFLAHKPSGLSFEEAAAIPLAGLTAHQCLEALGVRAGENLFVSGGAGGVGHFAVQLGVARGARVLATASEANHGFLRELGAEPLDYADPGLETRVRDLLGGTGADMALDLFGGDGLAQAKAALRTGGRLASVAAPPAPEDAAEVHYIFVRPSGYELSELVHLVDAGELVPHVEQVYPLADVAVCHERLEGGHVRGKLVLSIP